MELKQLKCNVRLIEKVSERNEKILRKFKKTIFYQIFKKKGH